MADYTPKPSDRFIPWYFIGFFAFFMLLLTSFCWIAIRSYTGEVGSDAYGTGLHYNKTLERAEAQARLGWKGNLTATPSATDPTHIELHYQLHDASGALIPDAAIHVSFVRPTQEGVDQSIILNSDGKQAYSVSVTVPLHGVWNVYVHATEGANEFRQSQTIVVP